MKRSDRVAGMLREYASGEHKRGSKSSLWLLLVWLFSVTPAVAQPDVAEVRNPRDMLRVMQIDASQLRFLQDDRPLVEEEVETLLQLLFRFPGFAQADIDRWTEAINDWDGVARNPDSYRFELFYVAGHVSRVDRLAVVPELARRLRFKEYFQLTIQHDERASLVYVRSVPSQWMNALDNGVPIREAVQVQGLYLKRLRSDETTSLAFAAARVQWLPIAPNAALGVTQDKVRLAELGMDISRLDDVEHRAAIGSADRECFYQMLAATRHANARQLSQFGRTDVDIARLIRTPSKASGDLYALQGLARRIIRIQVPDPDIRSRFGTEHYYEIEVFLPLERQVRFQDDGDLEGKVFTEYPFVLCVPELPRNIEVGEDVRVPIRFAGFFMKLWAYRTEFMSGDQPRTAQPRLQLSPLLIGPTVTLYRAPSVDSSSVTMAVAWIFTGCLLLIWILLWRASRHDRRRAEELFRKHRPEDDAFEEIADL